VHDVPVVQVLQAKEDVIGYLRYLLLGVGAMVVVTLNNAIKEVTTPGVFHEHPVPIFLLRVGQVVYQLNDIAMFCVLQRCNLFGNTQAELFN
jgi:hypothetical protein